MLSGCYKQFKSEEGRMHSWFCLNGVSYLAQGHGVTVMLDREGKVIPCEEPNDN
jgi:hypothetical protein